MAGLRQYISPLSTSLRWSHCCRTRRQQPSSARLAASRLPSLRHPLGNPLPPCPTPLPVHPLDSRIAASSLYLIFSLYGILLLPLLQHGSLACDHNLRLKPHLISIATRLASLRQRFFLASATLGSNCALPPQSVSGPSERRGHPLWGGSHGRCSTTFSREPF